MSEPLEKLEQHGKSPGGRPHAVSLTDGVCRGCGRQIFPSLLDRVTKVEAQMVTLQAAYDALKVQYTVLEETLERFEKKWSTR